MTRRARARGAAPGLLGAAVLVVGVAACGGATPPPARAPLAPGAREPLAVRVRADEVPPEVQVAPVGPTLRRAELDALLAAGPARLLGRVRVRAELVKGVFRGWRVLALPEEVPPAVLLAGDIVADVNGLPVSRPEELVSVFGALRGAPTVVVGRWRAGSYARVTVTVVE